jgi:uncharacterized OB-fold protein
MQTDNRLITDSAADRVYFSQLAEGRFLIPRCDDCAKHHFFPRIICPHCGSTSLQWSTPSGKGVVYSVTVVRRTDGDYNVCLIDLDEGPRMMSRVVDIPDSSVRIGMRVTAKIIQEPSGPMLVFSPGELG